MHEKSTFPILSHGSACALLIALLSSWPISAAAGAENPEWKIENLRQEIALDGARLLDLENPHGELHVRGGGEITLEQTSGEAVEVYATVQHHVEDPERPKIEHRVEGERFVLEVTYPQESQQLPAPWRKRRIDLVLYVPPHLALELESRHEKLRVKGMEGDVTARSVTGPISIITAGEVDARSDYGELDVRLTSDSPDLDAGPTAHLETLTGDITLTLPASARPKALLESRGLFTSDYSIDIEWTSASRKRGLVGAITGDNSDDKSDDEAAAEAPPLSLVSERGDLKLLRRPAPPVASTP